jgi:hypothetical protein
VQPHHDQPRATSVGELDDLFRGFPGQQDRLDWRLRRQRRRHRVQLLLGIGTAGGVGTGHDKAETRRDEHRFQHVGQGQRHGERRCDAGRDARLVE